MIIRNILILIIALTFLNCKSLKNDQEIYGDFYKKGRDFEYSLTLKKDNTFSLSMRYQDANPTCIGKWKKSDDFVISLYCDDVEDTTEMLSSGYMNEKEHKVQIISKNKLKFKNVLLKRK